MAGGKRSDRLSARDVEVLGFVARFGLVPREAVAAWAGTARTVTLARERRLRVAGLIDVGSEFWGGERLILATAAGLRRSGYRHLGPIRPCAASADHEAAVARLAAKLERSGARLLSEREVLACERSEGRRLYSVEVDGGRRFHRGDLIALAQDGAPPEVIEVELSAKGSERLDHILRSWRRAVGEGRIAGVLYRCSPSTLAIVRRAIKRTRTEDYVRAEEL